MLDLTEHRAIFHHNGFQVFRNAIPEQEVKSLARFVKALNGVSDTELFTRTDITNKVPEARKYVTDPRIVERVRACIGDDIRFVQQSDFHANYVAHEWHRDSANRRFGVGLDWDESQEPYLIVKAMLYLEASDLALSVMPCSHRSNIVAEPHWQDFSRYDILPRGNALDSAVYPDGNVRPVLVEGGPGDLFVFDIRLVHGGRILDPVYARFRAKLSAPKTQVAMVFGANNTHTHRFHSYTRYLRVDMGYEDLPEDFVEELREAYLLLPHMHENLFETDPVQLTGIEAPATVPAA